MEQPGSHAQYLNPFVMGSFTVIEQMLGEKPQRGIPSAKSSRTTSNELNIIVGVTGRAYGHVIFGMSVDTAKAIASHMMGEPLKHFDFVATSAVSELANMICGNALTVLSNTGCNCDFTPPTMIEGINLRISTTEIPAIVVPMTISQGEIALVLALKVKTLVP